MVWSKRAAHWDSSRTSTGWNCARPPSLRIAAADFSPRTCWMSARITEAPSAAAWRAQAKPMPWAAPVTTMTLFWRRVDMGEREVIVDSLQLKAKATAANGEEFNTEDTERTWSTEGHGEKVKAARERIKERRAL